MERRRAFLVATERDRCCPDPKSMADPVYKVLTEAAFSEAVGQGHFSGSDDDGRDGFIHLSAGDQLEGTLAKFFPGKDGLFFLPSIRRGWGGPSWEARAVGRCSPISTLRSIFPLCSGRSHSALGRTASIACPRSCGVNGLFGLGQALLLALDPERAHDLAVKSPEFGLDPRADAPDDKRLGQLSVRSRFSKSGRHGGGV